MTTTVLERIQEGAVAHLRLNRPDKANALNAELWQALRAALSWCDQESQVRAVVLSGNGKHFCAGIDLAMLMGVQASIDDACEARKRDKLRGLIVDLQDCVSSLETCRKPVIAAISGACLGGGLDIALAADFRYASADAMFGVREVDLGMVADVGTLQRLPTVVGQGIAREMVLGGADVDASQAGEIVDVLHHLRRDSASRQSWIAKGRSRAEAFTWDACVNRLAATFLE